MKPGYKQTEVGVVPEDWEVVQAADLNPFITSGSRGWAKYYSDRGALFIRITNLSRECIYPDLADQKLVDLPPSETEALRTTLQDGDILISITADIGIIGYINRETPKPAYINQHIACLRLPPEKADSLFQSYFLASYGPQKRFTEMTDVGAKSGINLTTVGKLKLLRPPLSEQRAVATALSDVDALLAKLDRLIAKKRDLKQAAMQQLLTGQTRLPGFHAEWIQVNLGSVCTMKSGEAITAESISDNYPYPCYGGNGLRGYASKFTHDGDFALIGRQGALCGNVVTVKGKFFASEHAVVVTAEADTDVHFLAYILREMNLNRYSEASAQPGLSVSKILTLPLTIPAVKAEQTAIAAVLSDMDAELTALHAQRDKTRAIKQAMMQELLTGKTRLV